MKRALYGASPFLGNQESSLQFSEKRENEESRGNAQTEAEKKAPFIYKAPVKRGDMCQDSSGPLKPEHFAEFLWAHLVSITRNIILNNPNLILPKSEFHSFHAVFALLFYKIQLTLNSPPKREEEGTENQDTLHTI